MTSSVGVLEEGEGERRVVRPCASKVLLVSIEGRMISIPVHSLELSNYNKYVTVNVTYNSQCHDVL